MVSQKKPDTKDTAPTVQSIKQKTVNLLRETILININPKSQDSDLSTLEERWKEKWKLHVNQSVGNPPAKLNWHMDLDDLNSALIVEAMSTYVTWFGFEFGFGKD
jgi:hypothetical protein